MFNKLKSIFTKSEDSVYGLYNSNSFKTASSFSKGKILSLYEQSLYLNSSISKRAEKVGQIQFVLKNKAGDIVEDKDGWLKLLDKPNAYQSGDQFWGIVQKYFDLYGFAIIVPDTDTAIFKKKVSSLKVLNSKDVSIILNGSQDEITKFTYKGKDYALNEVIYFYNPSVENPILPESLVQSAYNSINTEIQISQYQMKVIENGGKIETIFKIKDAINKEQVQALKEQYRDNYAGATMAGEPLFLGGDMDIVQTGLSPKELDFMDTKGLTLDDISVATKVPKAILGLTGGETYANADASIRIFLRETIKPLLEKLTDVLDWRLIPEEYWLDFIDPTPGDMEDKRANLQTASNVFALTTNEKREMIGLDRIKGGDEILIPFSLTELGAKPEVTNTELKKKFIHPLTNKAFRDSYRLKVDKTMTQYEKRVQKEVKKVFNDQKERLLKNIGVTKGLFDEVFNPSLEISLVKAGLLPIIRDIFMEQGQETMDTFELGKFNFTSAMETSLQKRADMFSESIINTQAERLQKEFSDSIENQENRERLVERIENLYSDVTQAKAEMIARTEVHSAMQDSNFEAYKQGGVNIKIWVSVGDERTREEHLALDGEERPINMPFSNGLMYPNEPNCRCSI